MVYMIFYKFFKLFTNLINLVTLRIRNTLASEGPNYKKSMLSASRIIITISIKEAQTTKKSNYLQPSKKYT